VYESNPQVAYNDIMEAVTELVTGCIGRRPMTRKQEELFAEVDSQVRVALGLTSRSRAPSSRRSSG